MHRSSNIRKISFKFPCDQPLDSNPNGIKLFGVGCMYNAQLVCVSLTLNNNIKFTFRSINRQFQKIITKNAKIMRIRIS